jgi:glutamine amidotransferase
MIRVVDYGIGNVRSIVNMFRKVGVEADVAGSPDLLVESSAVVLPGVGHFDKGMALLESGGWIPVLEELVLERRVPALGICLGMQLMTRGSTEGTRPGLGWLAAQTVRFDLTAHNLVVPHMGWNTVRPAVPEAFPASDAEWRFYFVHSYHVVCDDASDVLCTTTYGIDFCSGFARDNVVGVQFHPEKSHRYGMRFLKSFAEGRLCSVRV